MKNYLAFFALASLFLTNCINQNPQHVVLKGHILNAPSDTLLVYDNFDNYQSNTTRQVQQFNDTLNIGTAEYYFKIGEESTNLFLSPGDDMKLLWITYRSMKPLRLVAKDKELITTFSSVS